MDVSASGMSSLASENFTLTNLPPEELIVIVSGGGARKIAATLIVAHRYRRNYARTYNKRNERRGQCYRYFR